MSDISLPEVAALQQRARFFKDENGAPRVEISAVGTKDTIVKKVQPEHMARFKPEWDAFCDGQPLVRRPGTALTEAMGINQDKADNYIAKNIHNLEELAALSDGQCQAVGHGTLTDRKAAQALLVHRKLQQDTAQRDAVSKAAASVSTPAPSAESSAEMAEIKTSIAELTKGMGALVELLSKKKPGRPAKVKAE